MEVHDDRRTHEEEFELRVSEVHSLSRVLKWVGAIAASNLAIVVLGGVSIWVNDGNQDKLLVDHQDRIYQIESTRYTMAEATRDESRLTELRRAQHQLLEKQIETTREGINEIKEHISTLSQYVRNEKTNK